MNAALTIFVTVSVVLLLLLAGCGSSSGPSDGDVLISLTDTVIVPAYQELALEAGRSEAVRQYAGRRAQRCILGHSTTILACGARGLDAFGSDVVRSSNGPSLHQPAGFVAN